jgi:hypothetical protein
VERVARAVELGHRAAADAHRAEDDVERRAHHLLEVARLRDLLAEVGERREGVENHARAVCHLPYAPVPGSELTVVRLAHTSAALWLRRHGLTTMNVEAFTGALKAG